MKNGRKGEKRDFSPYDLNAVAQLSKESREPSQKYPRLSNPYDAGSIHRTLSLSGRTKNR